MKNMNRKIIKTEDHLQREHRVPYSTASVEPDPGPKITFNKGKFRPQTDYLCLNMI